MKYLHFDSVILTPYEDFADDLHEPTNLSDESNLAEFLYSLRLITPYALVLRASSENTNENFTFHSDHNQILVFFNKDSICLEALPNILKGCRQSANLADCIFASSAECVGSSLKISPRT